MKLSELMRICASINDITKSEWSVQMGDDCLSVFDAQKRHVCVIYLSPAPAVAYVEKHPKAKDVKRMLNAHLDHHGVKVLGYGEMRKVKDIQHTLL